MMRSSPATMDTNPDQKKEVKTLFSRLHQKRLELDIATFELTRLKAMRVIKPKSVLWRFLRAVVKSLGVFLLVFCISFGVIYHFHWPITRFTMFDYLKVITRQDISRYNCFMPLDALTLKTIRPALYCDFCRNVSSIERVTNMTKELFLAKYAYKARPLVVEGYQKLTTEDGKRFDFEFFKNLYPVDSPALKNEHKICEYQPKFGEDMVTVGQLLNMTQERQLTQGGDEKWYAGWINCDRKVAAEYSKHFLPHFLPNTSSPSRTFWTFMGSPKLGYDMHIDPVWRPQWHTQLHGQKKWSLEPPSECYFECPHEPMEVIMNPGDTIIFHNGMWYHETENIGDVISIGIAAEYD